MVCAKTNLSGGCIPRVMMGFSSAALRLEKTCLSTILDALGGSKPSEPVVGITSMAPVDVSGCGGWDGMWGLGGMRFGEWDWDFRVDGA